MRLCEIDNCGKKHYGKGLCKNHYCQNWYKENFKKHKETMRKYQKNNLMKYRINTSRYQKKYPERVKKSRNDHLEQRLEYMIKYFEKLGKSFDMTSIQYKYALNYWSKTIKKLDNYLCKNCDSTDNLHAHHMMPKKDFPELSLDLDNGVTLCEDCHSEVHGYRISVRNL